MATKKKVVVENPEDLPTKIIADSIVAISDGVKALRNGRLNEKALTLLLAHASSQSQHTVKQVLNGLENLRVLYTRR